MNRPDRILRVVTDPRGYTCVITASVWEKHVAHRHEAVGGDIEEVVEALRDPDAILSNVTKPGQPLRTSQERYLKLRADGQTMSVPAKTILVVEQCTNGIIDVGTRLAQTFYIGVPQSGAVFYRKP